MRVVGAEVHEERRRRCRPPILSTAGTGAAVGLDEGHGRVDVLIVDREQSRRLLHNSRVHVKRTGHILLPPAEIHLPPCVLCLLTAYVRRETRASRHPIARDIHDCHLGTHVDSIRHAVVVVKPTIPGQVGAVRADTEVPCREATRAHSRQIQA